MRARACVCAWRVEKADAHPLPEKRVIDTNLCAYVACARVCMDMGHVRASVPVYASVYACVCVQDKSVRVRICLRAREST